MVIGSQLERYLKKMNEGIKMVVVLVVVSVLSATSLSIVYEKTKPIIEEVKGGELKESLKEVFPDANYFQDDVSSELISTEKEGIKKVFNAYDEKDNKIGVVLLIDRMGFGGTIKILGGLELRTDEITGMKIVEHLETPGLGERISKPEFLNQFLGKSTKIKAEEVDAITGATISSTAVIDAVTENLNKMSGYITKINNSID